MRNQPTMGAALVRPEAAEREEQRRGGAAEVSFQNAVGWYHQQKLHLKNMFEHQQLLKWVIVDAQTWFERNNHSTFLFHHPCLISENGWKWGISAKQKGWNLLFNTIKLVKPRFVSRRSHWVGFCSFCNSPEGMAGLCWTYWDLPSTHFLGVSKNIQKWYKKADKKTDL